MGLQIHWWAPLQAKGFLKIVEFILALLTLSLVAGFSIDPKISYRCVAGLVGNYSYTFSAGYPFDHLEERQTINTVRNATRQVTITGGVEQSAQYFVAWGSLTLFYCVIAILVYMLVTANKGIEKAFDFLVATDIVFHAVWVLCWFIASVQWAVAFNKLKSDIDDLSNSLKLFDCSGNAQDVDRSNGSDLYVQAAISVVFGFLIQFVWAANIWWLVIDTSWYINWRASRNQSPS